MSIILAVLGLGLVVALLIYFFKNRALANLLAQSQAEVKRMREEAARSVTDAQKLVDQHVAEANVEAERARAHYETEARKAIESIRVQLAKAVREAEQLRRYASLPNAEEEIRRTLTEAMTEASALRNRAQSLLENARTAADGERLRATERARTIYEQADARLNQATRDAGRIIADAEKAAKAIAGDAYDALRDKQLLERAAVAMRNIVEGYGDRYVIPTHSLVDDLAVEFGYTSAGESLKSARAQSRRMVEQGQAATCEYAETSRRETAVRFVVDAFNGRVDAILTRVKHDNFGVLEQEIRDAFGLVNLNGKAFRNAGILPIYLDARLAELKWAVVVQELARKQQEEQRDLRARLRDEDKARKEFEEQMRQAGKDEELRRQAFAAAEKLLAQAAAKDKARLESELEEARSELAKATEKKLTIAQQTKKGHVYIISNVGAFGESVYKIGQTRREPQVRVDELGDASVPFGFDIHALIESDNAPALEHKLQRCFLNMQINKINSRKEFFRVNLKEIREAVDRLKEAEEFTVVRWTDLAAATQYRESLDIENDPQKLDKWLKRQEALADRELRLDGLHLSSADVAEPDGYDPNS